MKFEKIEVATTDPRGHISDILYKTNIQHVAIIESFSGGIRGNHYHKETTQRIFVLKGQLVYWWQPFDKSEPIQYLTINPYEMVTTPPYEVHALDIITQNTFIVFSDGLRGGDDYESDTFRVEPILTPSVVYR